MSRLTLGLLVGLILSSLALSACTFPDGTDASSMGYMPCAGAIASCCIQHSGGENDTCLSNGLCYSNIDNYVYQGACSDEWGSDRCPKYCVSNQRSFTQLDNCGDDQYCCSGEACCSRPQEVFEIGIPCVEEYVEANATEAAAEVRRQEEPTSTCKPWALAAFPVATDNSRMVKTDLKEKLIIGISVGSVVVFVIMGLMIFFLGWSDFLQYDNKQQKNFDMNYSTEKLMTNTE